MGNYVIPMSSENVTESCFEMIDRLECKKRWLNLMVWGGLIISPAVLGLDVLVYKILSHQKGILTDITVIAIALIAVLCLILIVGSLKKYLALKRLRISLAELGSLEETIYQEVIKQDMQLPDKQIS
jgi:hypothetical protein